MTYGERLQLALDLAGRDRSELAKALGISVQAVGQTLRGETKAHTAENCAEAAKFLNVDPYWLATDKGQPRPPRLALSKERDLLSEAAVKHALIFDALTENQRQTWRALLTVVMAGEEKSTKHADLPTIPDEDNGTLGVNSKPKYKEMDTGWPEGVPNFAVFSADRPATKNVNPLPKQLKKRGNS